MSNKSPDSNTHEKGWEWKIKADITGVFISGFQIKFALHRLQRFCLESDDAEFSHFFRPFHARFPEVIMMIEEMDSKGDGRINNTLFHLHQTSSLSAFSPPR